MALPDIIAAITKEADMQIAASALQHENTVKNAKTLSEEHCRTVIASIEAQKQQSIERKRRAAAQHAEAGTRNAVLQCKRRLLDTAYAAVLEKMSKAPESRIETLLRACLATVHEGEIRPAKAHAALLQKMIHGKKFTMGEPLDAQGGFLCITKNQEHDFLFHTLVTQGLRSRTELQAAHDLFPASRA